MQDCAATYIEMRWDNAQTAPGLAALAGAAAFGPWARPPIWRCVLFESLAYAMGTPQAGGAPASGTDMLMQFLPLIIMFAIFWFLLIRPQQKRAKAHKQMLSELKRGDHVMTSSGLLGRILEIDDEQVLLECGEAKLRVSRGAIGGLLSGKGGNKDAAKEEKK